DFWKTVFCEPDLSTDHNRFLLAPEMSPDRQYWLSIGRPIPGTYTPVRYIRPSTIQWLRSWKVNSATRHHAVRCGCIYLLPPPFYDLPRYCAIQVSPRTHLYQPGMPI